MNKIALSSNDDKRIQSIHSTETYAYGTSAYIIHVKEKIRRYNIIQKCLTSITFQKRTYKNVYYNTNINKLWLWKNKCIVKYNK